MVCGLRRFAVFLAGIVSLCALGSQSSFAAVANYTDPAGYPAAWPAALATQAYTAQGNSQNDLEGNPDNSKGATPQSSADFSSGSGSQPSCYYYADGSILFFRVRLSSSPMALSGSGEPFVSATWNFLIDTDGDGWKEFVIEVDGTSSTSDPDDIVVIYDNANSQKFTIGLANVWYQDTGRHPTNRSGDGADGEPGSSSNWDADSNAYIWDFGRTRVVQLDTSKAPNSNNSEYFLDVQVPLAALDASGLGGPTMTANTPFLMAITTSNSNTDPTQKDIIFSGDFAMSDVPFPTGDPTTPSGQILQAPVVTSVTASACPSPIVLNATVMDALTVEGGVTVDTISNVVFQYWFDADGNGSTNEASSWVTIGTANTTNVLSQFTLTWNTTSLAQGQYFIRVVATDNQGNTTISTSQSLYPSGIYATFNNTCGSLIGDLAAFKTGATNVFATSNLTYTITVTNLGPTQATNVVVNDTLPAGVSFVSASGGGTNNAGVVGWPTISSFAVFATTNFTVTVTAPNSGTLTNRASVTAATSDSSTNNNTSSVITTVIPLADLLTTKTGATNILAGSNFTYTITVINLGPSTATNVMVSDTLPAGVTFVSASAGGTNSAGVVGWPAIATFVNGATTNFTVTVTAPAGGTLTNIAASTSSISDPSTNNNSSAVITAVTPQSDVTINKTGPANPDAASNFTYTITVTNLGPSTATDIAVSDTLPATVTFVSASGGGTNSGGVVGWPTIASLASGATTNFTLTVTAPASGGLTNLASVVTGTGDLSTNNNTSTFINTVSEIADIAITKTGPTNVLATANFSYTITVTNLGPSTASNVSVSDTLPAGVTFVSATGGGTNDAGVVGWPVVASFANGAMTNFTVTVTAPASGTLTNVASSTSATTDPSAGNNSSSFITTVTPVADVATTKSGPASVAGNGLVTYTITVTNLGPSTASNVSVTDTLPAGVTFVSASGGGTNSAGVVGWPVITSLANGATTSFTVTVTAPGSGTLTNVVSSTATTLDPEATNNDGSAAGAIVVTFITGVNVSGTVYSDVNHNAQLDSGETGTGLSLFTKLIPTASPTSAVVVAAVNSATGAYTLTNVASGNYILIVDDNNSAADVTPTIPSGWVGTEVPNQTRVNVVVNSADVPNQNFGLFGGGTVSGVVFEDNGAGGGTANDGVQNGSEAGIAGVTVKVTDNSGATVYDTATTDGAGTYTVFTPGVSATLKIVETNLTGYVSTGAGVGTTGGSYNRPTDTVTFSNVAGTSYSGVNFGDVPTNLFAPDHQQSALPGATVVYAHTFVAGSVGQVTFTTLRAATPNIPGWNEVLYLDANCDALLDAADTPITAAIAMTTGQKVCILVKEFVPASAPFGAQDVVTVTASFDYTGATPSLTVASTRTDVTTVGDLGTAGLTLVKNADKASALPGEVLTYTIEYHNASGGSLTNIFIHDMTPAFTTFVAATNAPVPLNLTGVTITAPSVGASGPIVWQFTGSLAPNTGGSVRFQVKIEE
jgi:uncharacterized repeat protein (TIGR01451 family)